MFARSIAVVTFIVALMLSIVPIWNAMERFWVKDVAVLAFPPKNFPVLVSGRDGTYSVAPLDSLDANHVPVTQLTPDRVGGINQQLTRLISKKAATYAYLKVEVVGQDCFDVTLEVPTLRDSRTKAWYRITGDKVIPQHLMSYGPGFAFVVAPVAVTFAALCSVLARKSVKGIMQRH